MSKVENQSETIKKAELEDLGPGIRGRLIPPEERVVNQERVKKLAEESGSEALAEYIYNIYKVKPPKKK